MSSQNTNIVETKTDLFTSVSFLIINIKHYKFPIINYLFGEYMNEAYLGHDNQNIHGTEVLENEFVNDKIQSYLE